MVSHVRGRGWCIPSGSVDEGETPEQAAERELMEEAGCTATDLRPFGSVEWERPSGLQVGLAFVGRLRSLAQPTAPSEADDVRLMSLAELRENYFDWSPYYEAMFQRALEALN
ncbi:MAG: hypothetical protein AMXMBFR61_17310 [Fimbriimonadales bacterium]